MKRGTVYGIGVGPGDPELLTLKAARLIQECDVIACINSGSGRRAALDIVAAAGLYSAHKPLLEIDMPMTRDACIRQKAFESGADSIAGILNEGKTVAFLTLGDPTVYSTYGYLHMILLQRGYDARLVPGVTSFCAASASLGMPLCEDREQLHLIPGGEVKDALSLSGTKVFMKGDLKALKAALKGRDFVVRAVENCGMKEERRFESAKELNENAGYLTVTIVKEKKV